MLSNKIIIYLLLVLIFPIVSFAQDFSVDVTSESAVTVCTSETVLLTARVTNLAASAKDFTVNLDGSASSFSTVVPPGFILKPGESKNVYIYVTPSSRIAASDYKLNLIVSSDGGVQKAGYDITVRYCYGVKVSGVGSKEVCSCSKEAYDILIENVGKFDEVYDLSVEGNARNWVELSQSVVALGSGSSKTINAYVNFPCDIDGKYTFTVNLISRTSNAFASVDFPVKVLGCFAYTSYTNKDYVNLCENSVETLIISIENNGNQRNSYNLNIDGPSWIYLENKAIVLGSGQTGRVNLIVNPGYGVGGDFDVRIKILSEQGNIKREKTIKINVKKCHSVLVDVLKESDKICAGLSNVYEVVVKNDGEFLKDYKLDSDQEWSSLNKYAVKLSPEEEDRIGLEISAVNVSAGKYKVQVGAIALDESEVSSKDSIEIEVVSSDECYKTSISARDIEINIDSSATLPVLIKNMGNIKTKYVLDISGTASSFVQLNPAVVEVDAGKSETVYLYVAPGIDVKEDNYGLTISSKLEDGTVLSSEKINIAVESKLKKVKEKFENESLWQRIKRFFAGNEANVTVEKVEEKPEVNVTEEGNVTKLDLGNFGKKVSEYKYYILAAIIIIIIIIILLTRRKESFEEEIEREAERLKEEVKEEKREKKEKKEEKEEREEFEEGNLWKYVLGIIIIAVIIFLIWKYFVHIDLYKYYVIVGLIILLIIVLIVRYWKDIVDFFEEEIEEEPKEEKEEKEIKKEVKKEKPKKKRGRPRRK